MLKEILSWLKTLVLAVIIALVIRNHVFALYVVDGLSMQPTLADGEILIVNNFTYKFWKPERGDIIVFKKEDITGTRQGNWLVGNNALVKRVIALPGDTVLIESGQVWVNGSPLAEEYIDFELNGNYGPVTIEEGWLFVLGDNRHPGGSLDSRSFGPIPVSSVIGRADYIILPSPHRISMNRTNVL